MLILVVVKLIQGHLCFAEGSNSGEALECGGDVRVKWTASCMT